MLRTEKALKIITAQSELEAIILRTKICRVGMIDGDFPYVLAFNFGYKNKTIFLHTSKTGKKIDVLKANNKVCVQFDTDHEFFHRHEHVACSYRLRYRSVIARGEAEFVENYEEKIEALEIFMENYAERKFTFSKPAVDNIAIIKIPVASLTGRSFEY